jgi:hypothetical protein
VRAREREQDSCRDVGTKTVGQGVEKRKEEERSRVALSLREVRRDKHRAQAVATGPVRTGRVGSGFQMGHIWEPVVTLWLPRD